MKTTKQRLEYYLSCKGLKKATFEQSVGAAQGFVNNIGKSIGGTYVEKISRIYPDLSIGWLLSGEGEMLKQVPSNVQIGDGNTNQQGDNTTTTTTNNYSNGCERAGKVNEEIMNRMLESLSEQSKKHLELLDKALSIDRDLEEIKGMIKQVLDRIN